MQSYLRDIILGTKTYSMDPSIDVYEWAEQIASSRRSRASVDLVVEAVESTGKTGIKKKELVDILRQVAKIQESYAYTLVKRAEKQKRIRLRKGDLHYVLASQLRYYENHRDSRYGNATSSAREAHEDKIGAICYDTLRYRKSRFTLLPRRAA